MITQSINLNLIPGGVAPRINVSQYDYGSRTLEFNLYNGSTAFSVPSGSAVTIQGTKADLTGFQYECTFEDSTVTADLEQQMTVFAGEVTCEIVITYDSTILGTGNFILNVEQAALPDDTVISDTELPLIERAVEAVATVAAYAEAAATSATNAATSETNAATSETNAATSATSAASSSSSASTYASNASTSATNAATSESNASDYADSASASATSASTSASAASTYASNASTSATSASTSATNAATSATNAATSATEAAASAEEVETALTTLITDEFDPDVNYVAGDHFIDSNIIYTVDVDCIGITPPNANYYTATTIAELIEENASDISTLNSSLTNLSNTVTTAFSGTSFLSSDSLTLDELFALPTGIYQARGLTTSVLPSIYGALIVFQNAYYRDFIFFDVDKMYFAHAVRTATSITWHQLTNAT